MRRNKKNTKTFEKKLAVFLHTIGNNLYALRMARNESLQTVAKGVKMNPASLSKIEKGLCPYCRLGTLIRLCKYYKANLPDIVS